MILTLDPFSPKVSDHRFPGDAPPSATLPRLQGSSTRMSAPHTESKEVLWKKTNAKGLLITMMCKWYKKRYTNNIIIYIYIYQIKNTYHMILYTWYNYKWSLDVTFLPATCTGYVWGEGSWTFQDSPMLQDIHTLHRRDQISCRQEGSPLGCSTRSHEYSLYTYKNLGHNPETFFGFSKLKIATKYSSAYEWSFNCRLWDGSHPSVAKLIHQGLWFVAATCSRCFLPFS